MKKKYKKLFDKLLKVELQTSRLQDEKIKLETQINRLAEEYGHSTVDFL